MRSLSSLFLIGCVAAASLNTQYHGWKSNQEYRYKYSTQVLTGIPELNEQYSGVRLTAEVRVQPRQDSTCRVQLENPRFVSYNDVLEMRKNRIITPGQEQEIPSSFKTWLQTPFTVFHKRGLVEKIQTENGEPEFIVNVKKALISQLQNDLSQSERRDVHDQNQVQTGAQSDSMPVFTNQESSILGKCETVYTVSKLPEYLVREFEQSETDERINRQASKICEGKDYFEIIKTKNLDKCTERPVYHKTLGFWANTDGAGSESLPSHSSVTRTIICGSLHEYTIRKVTTENDILISTSGRFMRKEKVDISSFSTLELESVERMEREISEPSSPKGYPSLVFEYPSGIPSSSKSLKQEVSQQQQQQNQGQQQGQGQQQIQAPHPDMTSAPKFFSLRTENPEEIKQKVVEVFAQIVESTEKMTESSKKEKDVASLTVVASRTLSMLSYDELREVEQAIKSHYGDRYESLIQKAFFDLISISATNPCMKLIKDKVVSGEIKQDTASWAWILSNSLRSVKTPTEELLGELVELLKHENIQSNKVIRAAYAMGLTELIHKGCVNPESMKNEFPYKIYGQMCHREMSVIKDNLVPYLAKKLQESSKTDMGSVILYINALGNLGTEESSEEILKVVEGRTSSNPHPRSVAVYMLIRPALEKPSIYRPVFMSLIANSVENPEVRMAAITALTYCSPSTADLQKIAIRTWFEPSTQVSTYIYSTLQTLSKLEGSFPEYESIKMKAQSTLRLAKPSTEGLQHSRNLQVVKFVESLKTAVSHKLQWTSSEESFFPKSIYFQAQTKGPVSDVDVLETTFYMQGAEFVLDKLYKMYSDLKGQNYKDNSGVVENMKEVEQKMRNINLEDNREDIKPEAHLTLKFLGLQNLFSVDEEYVRNIVRKISSDFMDNIENLERGMNLEHLKILDLAGREMTMPTESGMPAILSVRNPTVAYNKAEIMVEREHSSGPKVEIRMKSVTNYKRQVQAGVVTAFTGKFHGAAVEVSMHIAIPQKIELTYKNGQVLVSLKNSEEPEYQMEKPLLEFDVHPYTCAHLLSDKKPVAKGQNVKTIKSKHSEKQREFSIGKPFGLDAKIKVSTEESGIDLYKLWDELKINGPVFLAFWPNPITSSRRTTITLLYNPQASEVKELNFYLTVGMGKKDINSSVPQILFPTQNNEQKIEKICAKYATQQGSCQSQLKIKQQTPDDEIIQQCQQEKEQKQQHQQQQQQLFQQRHQQRQQVAQQNQPQQQERHQQIKQKQQQEQQQQPQLQQLHQYYLETELLLCQAERQLVKEEKNLCIEKLQQQGKSQQEAQKECIKVYELSKQQQKSKAALREVLQKLNSGRAMTISMKTVLRAREESENREIETQITVGDKMEMGAQRPEKTQVTMKLTLKTPALRKPFDAEIHATGKIQRPNNLWEVEEILKEEISGKILIQGEFGLRGEQKERFGSTIVAVQSDKYLKYVRESEEKKECEIDQSKGRKLSEDCKKVRWQAASLDLVHAKLSLPRSITQNRFVELASEAVKVYYLPYLSQKSIEKKSHGDQEEYEVEARVAGHGETLSVKVSGNGDEVLLRDIRLGKSAKHLLPICTRFNLMTRVMQKLTSFNSPSSCVIESGKVETFDRMEYDYQLNNCEHIVFTESSPRPRITVSTRKTPEKQEVTMVVDGHKYEVEIKKDSRHSRDNMAVIKVNGEVKQWRSLEQQQEQQQQQQQQQLQQYMQNQQLQQILQSQQQQLQQQQQQQQQKQYYDSYHQNVYDDEDTYITNFKDGVYSIVSKKYGVSVIADGERMEVKSYQHVLRNRVAGLCGDLNGEITGDLKSSKRCMMPKHKLAALSFMLEDGKCGGIQEQEKSELRREESRCVRKEVVPTKVSQLFKNQLESKRKPELRHIVEVIKGETCISKELVRVCHSDFPKEISSRQVRFTCISGPKAEIYKRRAEYGDNVEELSRLPTQYVHLVHEPSRC